MDLTHTVIRTDSPPAVVWRVDFLGTTTLYFVDVEPPDTQLMHLVPGYAKNEVMHPDDDPRHLPPNIILRFDRSMGRPTSISFPAHPCDGGVEEAWVDEQFQPRLIALLGEELVHAIAFLGGHGMELPDERLLRWRAVSLVTLGGYNHHGVNLALGLQGTGWLGHRYT